MLIVDVTIPFVNRMAAFEEAAAEKRSKYEELRSEFAMMNNAEVVVVPWAHGTQLTIPSCGLYAAGRMPLCSESCASVM